MKGHYPMNTISVSFDSLDEAELAISRLRRSDVNFRVKVRDELVNSSRPSAAPMIANILYPFQPVNMMTTPANMDNYQLGNRVMLTSDIMGLPIYKGGETQVNVTVSDDKASKVRSILVNSGGHLAPLNN
jgi:hypothetical protein